MSQAILQELTEALHRAVTSCHREAAVDALRWEVPKDPTFGDLSSSAAFRLASAKHQPPPHAAQELVCALTQELDRLHLRTLIDRLEANGGFVNVFLSQRTLAGLVRQVNRSGAQYGRGTSGQGYSILVEFVSANPTGPLSVAHGRQAAVGDALARVLEAQEFRVVREYLLNDEGHQIDLLGRSLQVRYGQLLGHDLLFPEDGYHGAYVSEVAKAFRQRYGDVYAQRLNEETLPVFVAFGTRVLLKEIQRELERFRLCFDRWTSQRRLRMSGKVDRVLKNLQARGVLYEQDHALWFASTKFGDDKDRVVKKQTGELTYFTPDIAYHQWKYARGYDQMINLWGPDHHGYIARVKAAMKALELPEDALTIRIVQLVTLSRHGKPVPMSKRQGEFVTFQEILDEVGIDATRFFYLMRTMESHLDFDLELAKSQSQDNPVYYVQYAHARICSILGYARAQLPVWKRLGPAPLDRLTQPEERLLVRTLFQFPMVVAACANALEPHGITAYLQKLAEHFHVFYTKHRVISDNVAVSRARLELIRATRWVLANGLELLGICAPQRMVKEAKEEVAANAS